MVSSSFTLAVANALWSTLFSVYLFELGASFLELGLLTSIPALVSLFLAPIFGSLSDVVGKRPLIVFSLIATGLVTFTFSLVRDVRALLALFTLSALLGAVGGPALNALAAVAGGRRRRALVLGGWLSVGSAGWLAGSLLVLPVLHAWGVTGLFVVSSALQVLTGLAFAIFYSERRSRTAQMPLRSVFAESIRRMSCLPPSAKLIFAIALLCSLSTQLFFPLFAIKLYLVTGRSYEYYALLSALNALVGVVAPVIYGWLADRVGRHKLLTVFLFIRYLYMLSLALVYDPLVLSILWCLPIWAGYFITLRSVAVDVVGDEHAGTISGVLAAAVNIGAIVGPLVSGLIADALNVRANIHNADVLFLITPVGFLVAGFLSLRIWREIARQREIKL